MIKWLGKHRKSLARWVGTLLTIVLLLLLLKEEGGNEILSALQSVRLSYFILAALALLASRIFVALRWHALLHASESGVSFWRITMLTFTGLFSSNFLPTTIGGDVVRLAGVIQLGGDRAISLASLVADRLIGMAGMTLTLPFGLAPLLSSGAALQQSAAFLTLIRSGWDFVRRTLAVFRIWLNKPAALLLSSIATLGNMAFIFLAIHLLALGMGRPVSYTLIAGLWSLTYFVTLIPVSVNGYGVQELSLTFLLSRFGGLSHSESLAIAVLIRSLFILTSLPGAFFLPAILSAMSEKKPSDLADLGDLH